MISFLVLLSAGLFLSELFRRLHLPYVVSLIIAGILIGPFGIAVFETTPTIEFIGSIGLTFLMFMAGLETRLSNLKTLRTSVVPIAFLNSALPFIGGFAIAWYFGYGLLGSLLLGIIFVSSSIAVVVPSLEANGLLKLSIGRSIIAATIFEDVLSLLLLSLTLQYIDPITLIPLPVFYILLFFSLIGLKIAIPAVRKSLFRRKRAEEDRFEQDLRFIFATLIAVTAFFEILGLHPIIAGFFTGLALSESIQSKITKQKLHAISYGLFIPAFFVIIGTQTDVSVFWSASSALLLAITVVMGSMLSKFVSGWIGGRLAGFNSIQSSLIGVSSIPQLSTTLAVAFTGLGLGLLDQNLITAMILLSVVTTMAAPFLVSIFAKKLNVKPPENPAPV